MWVYQKPESSEPLEPLSAPSVPDSTPLKTKVTLPEPNEPFPAEGPSQAVPAVPELMETPRKRSLRADHSCILLAGAYLFGAFLAGVLSALCSAGELETLDYYLSCWRTSFAAETAAQAMGLFRTELLTASGALTVLLLLGLSAIGSLPIFCFLILYGAGAGMLSFQLLTNLNWKALLVYSDRACRRLFVSVRRARAAGQWKDPALLLRNVALLRRSLEPGRPVRPHTVSPASHLRCRNGDAVSVRADEGVLRSSRKK